jgi:LysM repeat protein
MSTSTIHAQTLRGSGASMDKQHRMAVQHDYTFLTKAGDVDHFIQLGLLVPVKGDLNYETHAVSFPYARPAVQTFVQRLAAQYRAACGEKLVVTSLTRPTTRQPRNASDISVHPTGMAVDLRVSNRSSCRRWLESTLLSLEKSGVLEATRERYPAHYHVAIFPTQYASYVDRLVSATATHLASTSTATSSATATVAAAEAETEEVSGPSADAAPSMPTHRVARGESLWSIARDNGTTVGELMALNGLSSSQIKPGQTLTLSAVATDVAPGPSAEATQPIATHRVSRGESLWSIARRNGTTVGELMALNDLASSNIKPGQTLTVNVAGDDASGVAATATYRVASGDTLWSIARAHDMTVAELKALNGLGSSRIKPGQTLTVSAR